MSNRHLTFCVCIYARKYVLYSFHFIFNPTSLLLRNNIHTSTQRSQPDPNIYFVNFSTFCRTFCYVNSALLATYVHWLFPNDAGHGPVIQFISFNSHPDTGIFLIMSLVIWMDGCHFPNKLVPSKSKPPSFHGLEAFITLPAKGERKEAMARFDLFSPLLLRMYSKSLEEC